MTVDDFTAAFRTAVQDLTDPPFWSTEEIVSFLNEAVQEACERAKLIEDRSTSTVCTLPIVVGQDTYPLHPSVLEIKRATFNGRVIDETSVEEEDSHCCGWEQREGQPRRFIYEPASGARPPQLRLVPRPNSPGAIALTVYRGALRPLSACARIESPELPARFHTRLLHWMMYRAHLKQDADTFDTARAAEHMALFEAAFGSRNDANVQRKHRDDSPPLVHSSW